MGVEVGDWEGVWEGVEVALVAVEDFVGVETALGGVAVFVVNAAVVLLTTFEAGTEVALLLAAVFVAGSALAVVGAAGAGLVVGV